MHKNNTNYPNFKQIEQLVWRKLQKIFSQIMTTLLTDMDEQIAKDRDTKRYRLQRKQKTAMDSLFGEIELNRNYYLDRQTGKYVYLLDQYLEFEGAGGFSSLGGGSGHRVSSNRPIVSKSSKYT